MRTRSGTALALVAAYALGSAMAHAQVSSGPAPQAAAEVSVQPGPRTTAEQPQQTTAPQPEPCCKLAALTPVELEILTPASTKTSREGEEIRIRVAEPVKAGDKLVIPTGTEGFAQVIQVSRGKLGGKAGELVIGAPYLNLAGQRINLKRLRYGSASGKDRSQQAMIATAVVGLAGLFVSGGNVDVASGTRASAVVTADTFVPVQP